MSVALIIINSYYGTSPQIYNLNNVHKSNNIYRT